MGARALWSLMRKRKHGPLCHICGRRSAKYYYSRRLSQELGISQWQGVYLCPECYEQLERKATGSDKHGR